MENLRADREKVLSSKRHFPPSDRRDEWTNKSVRPMSVQTVRIFANVIKKTRIPGGRICEKKKNTEIFEV